MNTIRHRILAAGCCLVLLLLLAMCLGLAPTPAKAGGIGETEVRAAVETWVRYVTADARPDAVVERMEPYQVDGETVAYIAHLKGGGFCLTGADDLVLPVYFYSPRGTYDPRNPDYQYILGEINTRLKALRKGVAERAPELQAYQDALAERAAFWQALIAGRVPGTAMKPATLTEPISMTLHLTSQWDYESPYNDQTPVVTPGSDEHTPVGCAAVAMAQIMYYWKWPNTGVGDGSTTYDFRFRTDWDSEPLAINPGIPAAFWRGRLNYDSVNQRLLMNGYWDRTVYYQAQLTNSDSSYLVALQTLYNRLTPGSSLQYADFGAATYNWNIMQDVHADPVDDGDPEVAKLSYHVGIAVSTIYGWWASAANNKDVAPALVDHFRYDPDASLGTRDINAMTEEIQWLRPLFFGGSDPERGGHAWVVAGYNKGTDPWEFWINLGWGTGSDGWYSTDKVYPNYQSHTTRIAPLNVVRFVGAASPGDGSPSNPYQNIEAALSAAPDGATLIFKAGSVNTFSAPMLIINRPMTLKGWDVTITR